MKTSRIVVIGSVLILVILVVSYIASYNNLVGLNQKVESQWATVQVEYQRRVDLIPNLVNAVKGYQQFEAGLLTNITALRSAWISANTTADRILRPSHRHRQVCTASQMNG